MITRYEEWKREVVDYMVNAYGITEKDVKISYVANAYNLFEDPVEAGDWIWETKLKDLHI